MKYPIGIQDFESIIKGGYAYVDKSALIYRMVSEGKIYSKDCTCEDCRW